IVALILLASCSSNEPVKSIGEYEFPFSEGHRRLLYTYFRTPQEDTVYMQIEKVIQDDSVFITISTFTEEYRILDRRFSLLGSNKQLVEETYYFPDEPGKYRLVKPNILKQRILNPEAKYSGVEVKQEFYLDNDKFIIEIRETFEKDTLMQWGSDRVHALKFTTEAQSRNFPRFLSFFDNISKFSGSSYYAKDVGLIMYYTNESGSDTTEQVKL